MKRLLALVALSMGFLGVAACLVAIDPAWTSWSRVDQAHESVFSAVDDLIAVSRDRILTIAQRVDEAALATRDLVTASRDRLLDYARERTDSRTALDVRLENLRVRLESVDSWLETATASLREIRRQIELIGIVGAPPNPTALDDVIERIASLRNALGQTEEAIVRGGGSATRPSDDPELSRLGELLGTTIPTIVDVASGLRLGGARLAEIQSQTREVKARWSGRISLARVLCFAALAWIAAGQAALAILGWRASRRMTSDVN
jgi:hypothetical protein